MDGAPLPPLTGIGDGDAGEGILALPPGIGIGAAPWTWGELCPACGDSVKPNLGRLTPGTPPFAMWLVGAFALMVTELLRACSPGPPFMAEEPRATGGGPTTVGTAGVIFGRPFTGAADVLPF